MPDHPSTQHSVLTSHNLTSQARQAMGDDMYLALLVSLYGDGKELFLDEYKAEMNRKE